MSLRPPHIIDVKRDFGRRIYGYIVARNPHVIVLREFDGFSPGGFVVVPGSTVNELSINERWTDMIRSEGHASLESVTPWFATDTLRAVLGSLHQRDMNLKLECENCPDAEESGFHVGRIVALRDSSLDFVYFDSTGRWFSTPYSIPYQSITQIVVDAPYVTTFSKYVGRCPVDTLRNG